jgi:two-component system chemotaxis sensor kinase CheA
MLPEADHSAATERELQQLRTEQELLLELLQVDRTALRDFMSFAARTLTRLRTLLHRRAREPERFRRKLERLRAHYAQLHRRAAALPMPSLAQLLASTMQALDPPPAATPPTGDALLPALVQVDAVFMALTTIAQRTGMPLVARRAQRRRSHLSVVARRAATGNAAATGAAQTRLELALQQLAERLAAQMGKRIDLTTHGLEQVPDDCSTAFYDMLSQMLRNAIEHGIETPAERSAAGKSARGALLVEFRPRNGGHSELIFQDDGRGLNAERIAHAAVSKGMIAEDATLAQDPRQASRLIFHSGVSTAANTFGRGLGMGIVRDNVKRLNGQVQVATKRGQFTRIRIRLPTAATLAMRPASLQA